MKRKDLEVYYLLFSIALLVLGVFESANKGEYFYTFIFLMNIIAWVRAVRIKENPSKKKEKKVTAQK